MTRTEETYAAWLNTLGSDPVPPGPVADDLRVMRIVAMSSGDIDRFSNAYLDVLRTLAGADLSAQAKVLTDALVEAARAHHLRYIPGLPLMIDGVDCSPENVRHLERSRAEYRRRYVEGDVPL